jgi:DNA mismatch repair protein MutL
MSKIRVLSDHVANQIAAGEVVERPASVAKELVENAIDAGARRVEVDVEAGGRRLLRVADDGEGMTRDDAVLAFERHATSKITSTDDLERISTLGFRGEALASIASVARVELITQTEGATEGTRVSIEGGRMRDVAPAARPKGTTISVRELFFNVPARRKFLRSEATESFHLANLVTHYALAHPEIAFTLTNNGREVLRADPAADLRERAYQIFGAEFLENLLEVGGGHALVARVRGYVSAPRERRTTRDAQFLFVNGRYVRDRAVMRALSEGYRSVLPQGTFPSALLFLDVPLEEVDVNVHPAKTEVRFRRAAAVADAVRESVRATLATGGFLKTDEDFYDEHAPSPFTNDATRTHDNARADIPSATLSSNAPVFDESVAVDESHAVRHAGAGLESGAHVSSEFGARALEESGIQSSIEFGWTPSGDESPWREEATRETSTATAALRTNDAESVNGVSSVNDASHASVNNALPASAQGSAQMSGVALPPLSSAAGLVREVVPEMLTPNIRPLGQLEDSFIIATDAEGLLLIDQHVAHERILFDEYRRLEAARQIESQNLLVPETFDLTPAQAAAFDEVSTELEHYGFGLMRLSGRTVAVRAVPADLPSAEARNLLAEILDTVDAEKRGRARASLQEVIAARLACRAAIKINTPLSTEKMRWLIDRLLLTSSPTTCPHGRPVILRLTKRDIERGFQRP